MVKNPVFGVSVIVPTLNEEKRIQGEIVHLKRITKGAEVIIADGASTDRTVALARNEGARIVQEVKDPKHRTTIGAGRNAGARAAKNGILLFVDADTQPEPAFYREMLNAFKDERVVCVGCKIMPRDLGFMDQVLFEFLNLLIFLSVFLKRPSIAGPCVAYRRSAFEAAGGFDEEMEASEDQDLCIRAAKLGRVAYLKRVQATTSSRRLKKMGWLGLALDWGKTTLYFVYGRKNKRYTIVREV